MSATFNLKWLSRRLILIDMHNLFRIISSHPGFDTIQLKTSWLPILRSKT